MKTENSLRELNISYPEGDSIRCNSYTIKNGTVSSANNCYIEGWTKQYCYEEGSNAKICTSIYEVTSTLTNIMISGVTQIGGNESYTATLSGPYDFPETIVITMGGNTLTAGTDYTYDSSTGVITISKVTGSINITASGVIKSGTAIYFNPQTGVKCTSAEAVSTTGTKTGCMKWYIFNYTEGDTSFNMILDHNTTAAIPWNSSGAVTAGPTNIKSQLWLDTDSWAGVPTRNDSYNLNNGTVNYTINYSGHKARLITSNELAKAVGNTTYNEKTDSSISFQGFGWIFDRTAATCKDYGCLNNSESANDSYYTATTSAASTSSVNYVWFYGEQMQSGAPTGNGGLRPVITIPKSLVY